MSGRDWGQTHRVVAFADGLAAAGFAYEFPGATVVSLESLCFTLVATAGVANRQVAVSLLDSTGHPVFRVAAPAVQTAGLTVSYSFAPLVPASGTAAGGAMTGPLAGGWLPGNLTLAVTVGAAQAGDALGFGRLLLAQRALGDLGGL